MRRANALRRRLITIFQRKGNDGRYTRLFEHLDRTEKEFLESNVALLEGEVQVIGSVESQSRWLLVTTARVIWCLDNEPQMFPLSEITNVSADFDALLSNGPRKLEIGELQVETIHQEKHVLPVESGLPLTGMWNVLKYLTFLNRKIVRDLVESAPD